jgi:hypothetical protein
LDWKSIVPGRDSSGSRPSNSTGNQEELNSDSSTSSCNPAATRIFTLLTNGQQKSQTLKSVPEQKANTQSLNYRLKAAAALSAAVLFVKN